MVPRIARRRLGTLQNSFEGADRVFKLGELLCGVPPVGGVQYKGGGRECEADVARGGGGYEGQNPKYNGGG